MSYAESIGLGQNLVSYKRHLLEYWKCDESSGNLTGEVQGLVLTAAGSPSYSQTLANGLTGIRINTSGTDRFRLADVSWAPRSAFTIAFWYDDDGIGEDSNCFLSFSDGSARFNVSGTNGAAHQHIFDGSTRTLSGAINFGDDAAHLFVYCRESSMGGYFAYFDNAYGLQVTSASGKDLRALTNFSIAGDAFASNGGIRGQYAHIAIWDTILSESALTELYNSGSGADPMSGIVTGKRL